MKKLLATLILNITLSGVLFAQEDQQVNIIIPKVAKLNLVSTAPLSLTMVFSKPIQPLGKIVAPPLPSTQSYLVYSSIVNTPGTGGYRTITVNTDVQSPEAYNFTVSAGAASATGAGKKGEPVQNVTLSTTPEPLIDGIGSCYTGGSPSNGHLLTYGFSVVSGSTAYSSFVAGDKTYKVIYTLSEN